MINYITEDLSESEAIALTKTFTRLEEYFKSFLNTLIALIHEQILKPPQI